MASPNSFFQRQLLSTRQMVAAIAVLACVVYIILYSGRVVANVRAQRRLSELQKLTAQSKAFHDEIERRLQRIDDPAVIDEYAREERNWAQPGDHVIAPIIEEQSSDQPQSTPPPEPIQNEQEQPQPNWRLWWALVAPE